MKMHVDMSWVDVYFPIYFDTVRLIDVLRNL